MTTASRRILLTKLNELRAQATADQWNSFVDFFAAAIDTGEDLEDQNPAVLDDRLEDFCKHNSPGGVEIVSGANIAGQAIFAVASYFWDGGSAIDTTLWNLKELASSSIEGGPTAALCALDDPKLPGCAIHVGQDFICVQIFE